VNCATGDTDGRSEFACCEPGVRAQIAYGCPEVLTRTGQIFVITEHSRWNSASLEKPPTNSLDVLPVNGPHSAEDRCSSYPDRNKREDNSLSDWHRGCGGDGSLRREIRGCLIQGGFMREAQDAHPLVGSFVILDKVRRRGEPEERMGMS
jgi:hypothetical protein